MPTQSSQPTGRMRRSHVKSRKGCTECKRRHHKCDESHPCCGACTRLGTKCSLSAERHTSSTLPTIAPGASPVSYATSRPESAYIDQPSNTLDLEIMANVFLMASTDVFLHGKDALDMIQRCVRLAVATSYLLHEMMALTALHMLAHDEARRELLARASYHQTEALRLVQPYLHAVDEDHSLALVFFSSLIAMSSLAQSALDHDSHDLSGGSDPIKAMVHTFQLTRGIEMITVPHLPHIRTTWAWPILQKEIESTTNVEPQPNSIAQYNIIRTLAFGVESREDRQACIQAVEQTFASLSMLQERQDHLLSKRLMTTWPIKVDPAFDKLLIQGKPVALVILAYYAVMLEMGTGLWWVGNWPTLLVRHISSTLGEEWTEFLEWPMESVGLVVAR